MIPKKFCIPGFCIPYQGIKVKRVTRRRAVKILIKKGAKLCFLEQRHPSKNLQIFEINKKLQESYQKKKNKSTSYS
jgi:hypothetical protein